MNEGEGDLDETLFIVSDGSVVDGLIGSGDLDVVLFVGVINDHQTIESDFELLHILLKEDFGVDLLTEDLRANEIV